MKKQAEPLNREEFMSTSEGSQGSPKNQLKESSQKIEGKLGSQDIKSIHKGRVEESDTKFFTDTMTDLTSQLEGLQGEEIIEHLKPCLRDFERKFSSSIRNIVGSHSDDFKITCIELIRLAVSSKKRFKKYKEAMESGIDTGEDKGEKDYDIRNNLHHKFIVQTNDYLHNAGHEIWLPITEKLGEGGIKKVQKVLTGMYKEYINDLEKSVKESQER